MAEQEPIRVMTVDDHEIMRGGIRFLLLAFDDLELVAEAHSGEDAIRVCGKAKPDVVLMDMKMAEMDGIATTKAIRRAYPDVHVLFLTGFHDKSLIQEAMHAGAVGYLLKDTSKEDLANAIRAAKSGRKTLSPEAANDLVSETGTQSDIGQDLTDREREVLVLLAQGLSNKQIAKQLHRSQFTVRHHVSQIISKLDAANRSEAAVIAVQNGLVDVTHDQDGA
jgi:NarL family two-component system response regulator LiaR